MTLEELLAEISESGWMVNNLFQLDNGRWQANLRKGQWFTDYGKGDTPHKALNMAMDKLGSAEEAPPERPAAVYKGKEVDMNVDFDIMSIVKPLITTGKFLRRF